MKFVFSHVTDSLAAIVSCHGYFEIQKAETYNSYASGIGPVFHHETKERLPDPVVVATGDVEELGLRYDPEFDDLTTDDPDVVKNAVLHYIEQHNL